MADFLGVEELSSSEGTPYAEFTPNLWALSFITKYGGIDGSHHKDWVLDQVARVLNGTPVVIFVSRWNDGREEYSFETGDPSEDYLSWVTSMKGKFDEETGEYEYDYDEGIAP